MWKAVIAGTTALLIAGSSFVYAQQRSPDAGQGPQAAGRGAAMHARMTAEDHQALMDARVAGLKLTSDQEKNWPPVEAAIRDLGKQRFDRMSERRDGGQPRDAIGLLRERADAMATRGAGLKQLADAAEPLYKSLDDGQKRRLALLAGPLRQGMGAHRGRHPGFQRGEFHP